MQKHPMFDPFLPQRFSRIELQGDTLSKTGQTARNLHLGDCNTLTHQCNLDLPSALQTLGSSRQKRNGPQRLFMH
jgi:hypothetical protein